MDTFLKLTSNKANKNCNCITPFYINDITGINPNTGGDYTDDDRNIVKSSMYRISNARGCNVGVCCDPNDPFTSIDQTFMDQFKQTYPKVMPIYNGTLLNSIKLSTKSQVKQSGWQVPTPYLVCKVTKATIVPTSDPTLFTATNLVQDCFSDSCTDVEKMSLQNLISKTKTEMQEYTYMDDAAVATAIRDGNTDGVKQFIRKYNSVDAPLTFDDYNNRMLHIAAMSTNKNIMTIIDLLIKLKANINIRNKNNETPLHLALSSKNTAVANRLISVGANLTITNNLGETPIFYAIKSGDIGLVRMLYNAGAPLLVVDNKGNNLIHYAIIHVKSNGTGLSNLSNPSNLTQIQSIKSTIIKFLLDNGVNSEATNNAGLTPLELVKKRIDKYDKSTPEEIKGDNDCNGDDGGDDGDDDSNFINQVKEAFFNIKPVREFFQGANIADVSKMTPDQISLMEIQTMLFNNVIRNNPSKYSGYINVGDLPAGSPIDVLDTVCVGGTNTGNEDSTTCNANGGQIVKIKNKTTLVKLELLPEKQSAIDTVKQCDLYFKKIGDKFPIGTSPQSVSSYNQLAMGAIPTNENNIITAPTAGITYNVGNSSNNTVVRKSIQDTTTQDTTTQDTTTQDTTQDKDTTTQPTIQASIPTEHPVISADQIASGKQAAINNATRLATSTTASNSISSSISKTASSAVSFINNNIWIFGIIILIILIALGVRAFILMRGSTLSS